MKRQWMIVLKTMVVTLMLMGNYLTECRGQNPILLECMKISKAYRASSLLSFDVKFTYADNSTPSVIEDSSHSAYKMNGYQFWSKMDSVEYMQNDSFQVAVYHDEQLLTISLPSTRYDLALPLSQWDSLFSAAGEFTFGFSVDAGYKKITVDYNEGLPMNKFEMWYDSVNYRIQQVRYKIDDAASDEVARSSRSLSSRLIVVNIVFSNYQTGLFTKDVFNSAHYFYKYAGNYNPTDTYEGYQLFLLSPALK